MPFLEAGKWDFVHWDWDSWKKNNRKMGMGFQIEQHRLGLWDLSWDLKKTISWEMGLGPPPPSRPSFDSTETFHTGT